MKNFVLILTALVLCAALFILFYKTIRTLHAENMELRLDPLGEDLMNGEFHHNILAIGSSSIQHWPFEESGLGDDICFNAGIGGQSSKQVLLRFERLLMVHKPDYLIVQTGMNDIKTLGVLKNREVIIKDFLENIGKIFALCDSNNIVPLYVTNFPTGKAGLIRSLFWDREMDRLVSQTNDMLKGVCREKGYYVLDAYELLSAPGRMKRKPEYSADFMHLNEAGYKVLNNQLKMDLQKIIK